MILLTKKYILYYINLYTCVYMYTYAYIFVCIIYIQKLNSYFHLAYNRKKVTYL